MTAPAETPERVEALRAILADAWDTPTLELAVPAKGEWAGLVVERDALLARLDAWLAATPPTP